MAKKDSGIDLADPAAQAHPDPVIAAAALNVALWGIDPPPRILSEADMLAKALEDRIRRIADERVRNVPIRNRVRLLYTFEEAVDAIGCKPEKLKELINDGSILARNTSRDGKSKLIKHVMIDPQSLEEYVARLPRVNSLDT